MKPLIIVLSFALQIGHVAGSTIPPREVQALVTPVLDLRAQAESLKGEKQQAAFEQSERLVGRLFQTKTRASDEALVVLMNYYLGESLGPDLVHEVTLRGRRMLPLLLKYRNGTVAFTDRKYPSSILQATDVRDKDFDNAINSVRAGRVFGEK